MTSPARTIIVPAVSVAPSPFAFLFPGSSLKRWPVAEPDDVLDYSLDVTAPPIKPIKVDFPAPFGPMTPVIVPGCSWRSTWSIATKPP